MYAIRSYYVQGRMPVSDVIIMASDLLYMGLIGKPRKLKKQSSASGSDFDASKFVGVAVAQLGMSPRDAWEMCLVDFQRAIEAKYPEMFASDASITRITTYNVCYTKLLRPRAGFN